MLRDVLIDLWSGRCAISRLGKGTTTHPHVANALNGLALRLLRAGGFVEAAPLYQHVLAIRKEGQVYRK